MRRPMPNGPKGFRATLPRASLWLALPLLVAASIPVAMAATGAAAVGAERVVATSAPVLALEVSPSEGEAPLNVTAIATVSGGEAPYALDVCFGTVDHTSPVLPCGTNTTDWNGSAPLDSHHIYLADGNFSVLGVVTDALGDQAGASALVVVRNGTALNVSATVTATSGSAPFAVTFNDTISDGSPPVAIQWTFGDGTLGSSLPGVPVRHVYAAAGTYHPVLTVVDSGGHSVTEALPAIHVADAAGPGSGISWTPPEREAGGLLVGLVVGTGAAILAIRLSERRRWRREGNDLVERMEESPRPPEIGPSGPS